MPLDALSGEIRATAAKHQHSSSLLLTCHRLFSVPRLFPFSGDAELLMPVWPCSEYTVERGIERILPADALFAGADE